MYSYLRSEEFTKLEAEYPILRRAREQFIGLKGLNCVVVDVETTGLEPETNEIIEIAALKIERGEIADVFSALIKISKLLPPEIIKLTGITDEMLFGGANKISTLNKFMAFIGSMPLLAHNVDFDIPFLNHHLKKTTGASIKNPLICTLKLSQKLLPDLPSHKLSKVAGYFNIPTPLVHRAPGDVEITYQLWLKLAELLEKREISTLEAVLKFAV